MSHDPHAALVARMQQQIAVLQNREYAYDELHVYVSGIAEPWIFGGHATFEFDGCELLVVRTGPPEVPEYVFPIRQVIATELNESEG